MSSLQRRSPLSSTSDTDERLLDSSPSSPTPTRDKSMLVLILSEVSGLCFHLQLSQFSSAPPKQTPWPSLLLAVVFLGAAQLVPVQSHNYVITHQNMEAFALPYATTEHVPSWAFAFWGLAMAVVFLGIELLAVR